MISVLGRALELLALGACAIGAVAGLVGGARGGADGLRVARWMAALYGAAMIGATVLMEGALLGHDFSVSYVAQVGSRSTPLHITIVSLWSSLEGSILFWGCVLGSATWRFARGLRERDPVVGSYALGALLAIGSFFTFLVSGVADPFAPTVGAIPSDGPGPNPLLQNHLLMILHPPALYLGYVTMAVPWAMAAGALMAGRLDAAWMRWLRRWTLFSWSFLTLGILLGGWWSYEVLGWGGYWAWDPVENASFMPWLTATAFLHSAMVMERQGQLKGWTLTLAMASFLLTMLGTFMTRSGVFNSVHSFTQSEIGPIFLVFIAVVLGATVLLLAARLDALDRGTPAAGEGLVSRESAFMLNNLLFVAFTFTVLIGTLFPLIKEALSGERLSVGEPYFNRMSLPVCVALLFLMGVGPALPWGAARGEKLARRLAFPAGAGVLALGASLVTGQGMWATLTYTGAAFAGVVTAVELFEPARERARRKGEALPVAFVRYAQRARQRVGGYIIHAGVVMAAVAIAASHAGKQEADLSLPSGAPVEFAGYTLTFREVEREVEPHRTSDVVHVEVGREGRTLGMLSPRMNHYQRMREPIGTPAVRSGVDEDLYLSLVRIGEGADSVSVRVLVEPLVVWLWVGGLVMFFGAGLSLWPRRAAAPSAAAVPSAATPSAAGVSP